MGESEKMNELIKKKDETIKRYEDRFVFNFSRVVAFMLRCSYTKYYHTGSSKKYDSLNLAVLLFRVREVELVLARTKTSTREKDEKIDTLQQR